MEIEYSYNTYKGVRYRFCVLAVTKYKIFTWDEFKLVRKCFKTDLRELDAILTHFPNPVPRLKNLYFLKYEYEIRFYSQKKNEIYREVFKKLMFKLDDLIFTIRKKDKVDFENQSALEFSDIFVDRFKADIVIKALIENNFLKISGEKRIWRSVGRNSGIEIAALFKFLIDKDLIKEEFKTDFAMMSLMSKFYFGNIKDIRTFKRINEYSTEKKSKIYNFLMLPLGCT